MDTPALTARHVSNVPAPKQHDTYQACPKCYDALTQCGVYIHHTHRDIEWVHKPTRYTLIIPARIIPFMKLYCDRHHIAYKEG